MIDYTLEHIFSYNATLAPPEVIGPVPEGIRVNVYATGGEVQGPRLHGKLRPVGGDWLLVRQDGIGMLDVRATIEAHDGALIYITYTGVIDLGAGRLPALFAGCPSAEWDGDSDGTAFPYRACELPVVESPPVSGHWASVFGTVGGGLRRLCRPLRQHGGGVYSSLLRRHVWRPALSSHDEHCARDVVLDGATGCLPPEHTRSSLVSPHRYAGFRETRPFFVGNLCHRSGGQ